MTARSDRERAEQAVIAAAVEVHIAHGIAEHLDAPYFQSRLAGLNKAVAALEDLGLRPVGDTPTNAGGPQTSHDAATYMKRSAASVGMRVFEQIYLAHRDGYGLTTEQIEQRLRGKHQSISPRVTDLVRKGYIVDSGERRETTSGNEAIVWKPTELAIQAAREVWTW